SLGAASRAAAAASSASRIMAGMLPQRPADVRALHHLHAGLAHLRNRPSHVAGTKLDAAARVFDERHAKTQLARVERGELDAVIGCQPQDVDLARAAALQVIAQAGGLAVAVVEEAAVAVDVRIGPLAKDRF